MFFEYLFAKQVLRGVGWTMILTVAAMTVAVAVAVAVALVIMRDSDNPILRRIDSLGLGLVLSRHARLYPTAVLGPVLSLVHPPVTVPAVWAGNHRRRFKICRHPAVAAILGLGFNESAYLAEIFRAGFKAINRGQTEAAQAIANRLYLPVPLLMVAGFWYLSVTSVLMVGQHYLERHFGRGT